MINVVSNRKKRQLINPHFDAFSIKLWNYCRPIVIAFAIHHQIRRNTCITFIEAHYRNFYSSKTKKVRMIVHKQNIIRKKRKWIVLFIFLYTNYQLCNIWFNCQSNLIKRIIELLRSTKYRIFWKFERYISKCLRTFGLLFYLYPLLL